MTAIEPGPNLAAVAAARLAGDPRATIVVSTFEDWSPPGDAGYDAVFAATAWHWVDPDRAYPKAASLLRPGGFLIVVTTDHVSPPGGDRFFAEIQEVCNEIGESDVRSGPPDPEDVSDSLAPEIVGSGWFEAPTIRRHLWSREYTADSYLDVLRTYSGHITMRTAGGIGSSTRFGYGSTPATGRSSRSTISTSCTSHGGADRPTSCDGSRVGQSAAHWPGSARTRRRTD